MKITKLCFIMIAALAIGLVGLGTQAFAAHSGGNVTLLDKSGTPVTVKGGANFKPYSPKATCGGCHDYGSSFAMATKKHASNGVPGDAYDVPYPTHGVTAGYHFQQGRNESWNDDSRHYYHLPDFTSGSGMWGKY